ncbi:MAG TPA: PfkB family carbohydrate kinase [Pirellulales bacterium]|jgi:cytidyltransferase-like protein|nr:PfkB family carbohydrate kinase [Pirellulales bacterium]
MRTRKIVSLEDLAALLKRLRGERKRIVQCHGVFDLLHVGHLRHFEQAKQLGDVLVVTLTPDEFVNKGAGRPAFGQELRAEFIAALACVDYVAINRWPAAVETIRLLRPHVFAKGSEFRKLDDTIGHVSKEEEAIRAIGGEMAFTDDLTYSSSALINQYLSQFPDQVRQYLDQFARRYSAEDVLRPLRAAESLRALVVGETIIDEYAYCEALGKSGKEPVLATRFVGRERHGGGVLACANHLAGFCGAVDVLTFLGEGGDEEAFVRATCKPNVTPRFVYKEASPTIVKKRYVEKYLGQKLFEVYSMNDAPFSDEADAEFGRVLRDMLPQYDLVIVADYGHGLLSSRSIELLCREAPFLCVNTQSNAGNHGFNMISKYPRADYVCLAEREIALETRNQRLSPQEMVRHVAERLRSERVMMTQGKYGSLFYTAPDQFDRVPAFATQVVDRVGAGDAVLSLTSLCAAAGAPAEVTAFVGNVAGAEAVAIMGNQRSIERIPLYRHVECLLKTHDTRGVQPPLRLAG